MEALPVAVEDLGPAEGEEGVDVDVARVVATDFPRRMPSAIRTRSFWAFEIELSIASASVTELPFRYFFSEVSSASRLIRMSEK